MPLLVYPLLGIIVQKLMIQGLARQQQVYHVCFSDPDFAESFLDLVNEGELLIRQFRPPTVDESASNPISPESSNMAIKYSIVEDLSVEEAVKTGQFDLGVVQLNGSGPAKFQIYHVQDSGFSERALEAVGRRLRVANDRRLRQLFRNMNLANPAIATYAQTAVALNDSNRPNPLLTFIPLMLVLMTVTGAVYPAIDLTAGERERGTIEILVAAPVSRMMLLFGKFVAVLVVAMLTAVANLMAMVVTVYSLGLDTVIFGEAGVSFTNLALIMILLLVLAAFFSATLLCLTSVARSFKEAQAYLIPLMMVAFAPGLISLAPNLENSAVLSVIPLANVVIVGRDLLSGTFHAAHVLIALVSTLFYCCLALSLAAKIFGADSLLSGGGQSGWSGYFSDQNASRRDVASVTQAIAFLAILFPFFIIVSGLVSNFATRSELQLNTRLILNALVTILSFVILPLVFVALNRLVTSSCFFLRSAHGVGFLAAVLLGLSVWTWAYELEVLTLSTERAEEMIEFFSSLKVGFNEIPLPVKLICLALVPAICEEFTFRGLFLSAFRTKFSPAVSVVITAVLFGLFHVFVRDNLFLERFIPSTLMGLLLGSICLITRSIYPGMLLHALHNGLLLSMAHYEQQLTELGIGIEKQSHLPMEWILIALVPISLGSLLLYRMGRRSDAMDPQN